MLRGISPVGTASGHSCNFNVCWSMYSQSSAIMTYGLDLHASVGGSVSHLDGICAPDMAPLHDILCVILDYMGECVCVCVCVCVCLCVRGRVCVSTLAYVCAAVFLNECVAYV